MPNITQSTVVAVFKNVSDAQAAADDLKRSGFRSEDIYISNQGSSTSGIGTTGTSGMTGAGMSGTGLTGGMGTTSTGMESKHEGGIVGWFHSIFGGEDDVDRPMYEQAVSSGNVVLSVDVTEQNLDTVADVLSRHSPIDVHRDAASSTSTTATTPKMATSSTAAEQTSAIPVVQEELQVGKRSVLRGGVRVYSRVVERPVEETLNLREEHVNVQRRAVDRPATSADLQAGAEQVIEVEEYAEQAVVAKQARVVEEIQVGKTSSERTETVRDTVRHTEVEVENMPTGAAGTSVSGSLDDSEFRKHFTSNYGTTGGRYEDYGPAYEYGYDSAYNSKYKGRNYTDIESDLKSDYARKYPNSTWDKVSGAVQHGWNKVTGKA